MRKKILYIDPFFQEGHSSFNKAYIKALRQTGASLFFIIVKGYDKHLNIRTDEIVYQIPAFLERTDFGGLANRLCHWAALLLIRMNVHLSDYDYVFFANFDEISFYFSGIRNCILIPHINIAESNNKVKFFFLNKVFRKNKCIAFNPSIADYLNTKGNYEILKKPIGLPQLIEKQIDTELFSDNEKALLKKTESYDKVLFSPSAQSVDKEFLQTLVEENTFLSYLEAHNTLLLVKGNIEASHPHILVVKNYLSQSLYNHLFLTCDYLLLAYPQDFRYRVSWVLMECFANERPCFVSDTETFKSYEKHFCYQPYFSNANDLIKLLEAFDIDKPFYKNTKDLQPDFSDLL